MAVKNKAIEGGSMWRFDLGCGGAIVSFTYGFF